MLARFAGLSNAMKLYEYLEFKFDNFWRHLKFFFCNLRTAYVRLFCSETELLLYRVVLVGSHNDT